MADTLRYWDGTQWTEHISPRSVAPGSGQPVSPPVAQPPLTSKPDPTFAWAIALLPLALLASLYLIPNVAVTGIVGLSLATLTLVLALIDAKRLRANGTHVSGNLAWLGGGIYLIGRTVSAKSTPALPLVWFAGFGVAILGLFTFAAVYTLEEATLEQNIEVGLADNGYHAAEVDCPGDLVGRVGKKMICEASARELAMFLVEVEVLEDGGLKWQVQ